ncbi:MAG TPA: polyprenol monophosphomannose synthase [Bacteroidales bacterium]|nr:polyprenol monophosphomannose synthase [Bacteroidales bacterium]
MTTLVIIPTYNEKENIKRIILKVLSLADYFHVLVVDDGSPDGTASIVKSLMKMYPDRVFILERSGKLGLGTAYIAGFKWGLKRKYDLLNEMDADFSHPPDKLINLHDACAKKGFDVAIGSRYVKGINVVNWPLGRILMSYYASAYVRLVTGLNIKDTTAGFVCYKREVLENIALDHIKMKGYGFQIEMKFKAYKLGYKIIEVPIIFTDRQEGKSKMSGGIFGEALWGVIKLKVKSWFEKYERKDGKDTY